MKLSVLTISICTKKLHVRPEAFKTSGKTYFIGATLAKKSIILKAWLLEL